MLQDNLSNVLDYSLIEDLVYSECDRPHDILGAHLLEEGFLIAAFLPDALNVKLCFDTEEEYEMFKEDESGFFAVLLPKEKENYDYYYKVSYNETKEEVRVDDCYRFLPTISEDECNRFNQGIWYDSYKKMGAKKQTVNGVEGVSFAVWAPFAKRVSVVGDFNLWNGCRHQMRRLGSSGIFELFIPKLSDGELYKYEIKTQSNLTYLKADPYANTAQLRPDNASIVADMTYDWFDDVWLKNRKKAKLNQEPVFIYELHLGSFVMPEDDREFYNYRELAKFVADYVKEMGYTHVELMPVMEHPFDGSWGYQVTGYYAPTKRYGSPTDFMYFVDYLHQQGIGVILDWVPAHFPRDSFALSAFDGTCLYEHQDPRQGSHPHWGTLIFNYGRPEVSNFLISNALYWIEQYHVDGIRFDAVASMLYLDYGKNHGEWVANQYGGNENLEAIEFIKHLNSIVKKRNKDVALIAEESTAWPRVTTALDKDGLGFDFKWNMGWMNDVLDYAKTDPIFRQGKHSEMTFGMVYAYSENYILPFSHDEVVHLKGSMVNKMPGEELDKFANLRALYTYMLGHPGKKLLFMGQDFGQRDEWMESKALQFELLEHEVHKNLKKFVKDLIKFYRSHDAFYKYDYEEEGFKWLDWHNDSQNILSFCRFGTKKNDILVFVSNFSGNEYKKFRLAVPQKGTYTLIINSMATKYSGGKNITKKNYVAEKISVDVFDYSIEVNLPKFCSLIFEKAADNKKKTSDSKTVKKIKEAKSDENKIEEFLEKNSDKPIKENLETVVKNQAVKEEMPKSVKVEQTKKTKVEKVKKTKEEASVSEKSEKVTEEIKEEEVKTKKNKLKKEIKQKKS